MMQMSEDQSDRINNVNFQPSSQKIRSSSSNKKKKKRYHLIRDFRIWICAGVSVILVSFGVVLLMVSSWVMSVQRQVKDFKNQLSTYDQRLATDEKKLQNLSQSIETQYNLTREVYNETAHDLETVHHVVNTQSSLMAYQFAGIFAILASLISIWHISNHLRNYEAPSVQRKIIAILWMVPVYSFTSWLSLVTALEYFAVFKDFYEAFLLHSFLSFLIAVIGRGDRNVVIQKLAQNHSHFREPLSFPCQKNREERKKYYETNHQAKAEAVLYQCQFFTMQFVFFRPLTSVAMAVSNAVWGTDWDLTYPQFYIWIIANISVAMAFSGLLRFYHAVQHELVWCRPFPKFLCIKGIIFMTFWQGFVITIVAKAGLASHDGEDDATEWSLRAQNFLICLEMLFFAITHGFVFPIEEWKPGYKPNNNPKLFQESNAMDDFVKDVKYLIKNRKESKRNRKKYIQKQKEHTKNNNDNEEEKTEQYYKCSENGENNTFTEKNYSLSSSSSSRLSTMKKRRKGKYYVVYKACDLEEGDVTTLNNNDEIFELGSGGSGSYDDALAIARSHSLSEGDYEIDDHSISNQDDHDENNNNTLRNVV